MTRILTISVLALLASQTAAQAQTYAMRADVRGLDLRSRPGALIALRRLEIAATAFCSEGVASLERTVEIPMLRCRRDMTRRAVVKLQSAQVTAAFNRPPTLYASRGDGPGSAGHAF